jgi:hypothetical protein
LHHLSFLPHFPNAALDDPVILLDLCSVLQLCDVTELELELEQDFDEDERVLVLGLVLRLNVFVEYLAEEVFFGPLYFFHGTIFSNL